MMYSRRSLLCITHGLHCIEPKILYLLLYVCVEFLIHAQYIPNTNEYIRLHVNTYQISTNTEYWRDEIRRVLRG